MGIVPLIFTSDDPVYNTFNERIKVVAGIEFVIVATASGLSLSNYTIEMRVVDFRIVNKKGEFLTTVNIGESTDFYITILPPDALYELDNATITFSNTKFKFNGINSAISSDISIKRRSRKCINRNNI